VIFFIVRQRLPEANFDLTADWLIGLLVDNK